MGRAPRTKETLPYFLKWRRVTRPPLLFRWLTGSQRTPGFWGVTDCDCRRVTICTPDDVYVMFKGDKHDTMPQAMYDSRWHGQLQGWLANLTLEDQVRQELGLPRVVCEYKDVFSEELPRLPPHRDDLCIELHYDTSPISMTPHRMTPSEL